MGYSHKLLSEDERIDLDLHPHVKALILPVSILFAVTFTASWGIWAVPAGSAQIPGRIALGVLGVTVLVLWSIRPFLQWMTTHYVVTNQRLITRQGIIARTGRDMPLIKINDISFSHTVLERLLGCGSLVVESAGERGQLTLNDVPQVEFVQRRLYELSSTGGGQSGGSTAPVPQTG